VTQLIRYALLYTASEPRTSQYESSPRLACRSSIGLQVECCRSGSALSPEYSSTVQEHRFQLLFIEVRVTFRVGSLEVGLSHFGTLDLVFILCMHA
jgi:hypothetical protein